MARTPLVLVPGLLCDALLWAPQVHALGDAADCWIADPASADTMAQQAADVLRAAPFDTFSLAGLSMGGYIALEIMRQAPARVTHLALLDTTARPDPPEQTARRQGFIDLADRGKFVGITDMLLPVLIHPDRRGDAGLVATIKSMARNVGKAGFVRQQRAIMSRADSVPSLAAIECPTLVLCGREDLLTPVDRSEEMAARIPNARLEVIDHCGHLSTLEATDRVNALLYGWISAKS